MAFGGALEVSANKHAPTVARALPRGKKFGAWVISEFATESGLFERATTPLRYVHNLPEVRETSVTTFFSRVGWFGRLRVPEPARCQHNFEFCRHQRFSTPYTIHPTSHHGFV